jgi:hypothetical protein
MYSLNIIHALNRQASTPAENETTRHCSICRSRAGIVLHSAKKRSTAFIKGVSATRFLRAYDRATLAKRDALVESFF